MSYTLTPKTSERAGEWMLSAIRARHPQAVDDPTLGQIASEWPVAWHCEGERGLVVLTEDSPMQWGAPEAHLHVLTDGSMEAAAWLRVQLPSLHEALPANVAARVSGTRPEVVDVLREVGLGVSKLGLGGHVATMLQRLGPLEGNPCNALGLALAEVSTEAHVVGASELRRDYFTTHPEHGWGGTITPEQQAAIDARVRREYRQRLEESNGDFVLLDANGKVVGAFNLSRPMDSSVVGRSAGLNICIAPAYHGRGLGTFAYSVMVRHAADAGVEYLHGSTSNPGVIEIAAKLGRRIDNWLMRRDKPWIDDALAFDPRLIPASA